jgi:DNA uptake protein ComE-like DNA-binding protein
MKPYMLPLTRNEQSKTPGKTVSKTPGKMPPPSAAKFTSTVKRQTTANRFHSFSTPSKSSAAKNPLRQTEMPRVTDMSYIDNNTFIMNCSTSTEVDAPVGNPNLSVVQNATMPSFSPLMRKIEAAIDTKLTSFMETLNRTVGQHPTDMTQFHETIKRAVMSEVVDDDDVVEPSTVLRKPVNLGKTSLETTTFDDTQYHRTNRRLETTEYDDDAPFNFTAPPPKKPANRRVTTVNIENPRRSARISIFREIRDSKSAAKRKTPEKLKAKKAPVPSILNRSASRKVTKADHKKEVLELLNTGTLNQLKMLPKVGIKTAYQIITYRTMSGKFKNIEEVKKVPAMKGKIWENFLEVKI